MKIASIIMSLVFAGVIAQANEPAHTGHEGTPAAATETKMEKKAVTKKGKHADKATAATTTTTEEKKTEEKK